MLSTKAIYWALKGARVASDCLLLILNYPAHILTIIAFPCNKLALLEIKSASRFSLICFLTIYYDSQVLHEFGEWSILVTSV